MWKLMHMFSFSYLSLLCLQLSYAELTTANFTKAVHRYKQLVAFTHLAGIRNADELRDPVEYFPGNFSLEETLQWREFDKACSRDLVRVLTSLKENWAQRMIDADGKPSSGFLDGNVFWIGDFYECRHVYAPPTNTSSDFTGRYCLLSWSVNNVSLPMRMGACIPSTCDESSFLSLTNMALLMGRTSLSRLSSFQLKLTSVSCKEENRSFDAAAVGTMFLLAVFAVLLFVGTFLTVVDNFKSQKTSDPSLDYSVLQENDKNIQLRKNSKDSALWNFFKCFSILTNGAKILQTNVGGDLRCVHGIRFLSMSWVILGHTYVFAAMNGITGNMRQLFDEIDNLPFQAILHGTFSVDSFFLLSGFLLCYLFLKEVKSRQGKISWIFFYCHRYWRLTPVYAAVLAFSTALTIYLADGPFWPNGSFDPGCRQTWWWNLLYINNFVDQSKACMNWSWYLANDMQFYVISPIFLYALWRRPRIGLSVISVLLICSWIAAGVISYHYDLPPGYLSITQGGKDPNVQTNMLDYFKMIYIKPYTRIGPYLIGVLLGYIISRQTEEQKPVAKVTVGVGWFLATFTGVGMIYGFYKSNPGPIVSLFYNALSRSLFSASLAWVIYACLTGNGGIVNSILSCSAMVPLSRLTYCAYLVHPIIITGFYMSLQAGMQITHILMTTLFLGFLVMSYFTALVCSLTFESPLMAVEKQVLSLLEKRRSSSNNPQ